MQRRLKRAIAEVKEETLILERNPSCGCKICPNKREHMFLWQSSSATKNITRHEKPYFPIRWVWGVWYMYCVSPPCLVQLLVSVQSRSSRFKPGLLCQRIYRGRDARKIPHKVFSLQFSQRLFSFPQVFLLISQLETQKRPGQVIQRRSAPISLLQYYLRAVP